jgi:endonuclease-8
MPEGDTIFRTAERLRQCLFGQTILSADSPTRLLDPQPLVGRRVSDVQARGKHLLLHVDQSPTIHSHMGMTGSWHVYKPGERWQKPVHRAALVLEVADAVCVCFSPKTLELLTPTRLRRHPLLQRLGPDLLAEQLDVAEILRRFRGQDSMPLGEAVMNQAIVCGIGNVYKSEVLFLEQRDPFAFVAGLSDEQLESLVDRARTLMRANLQGFQRRTRHRPDGGRLWVYGRQGQACFRCGTPIRLRRQGDLGRTTYWCPQCQG